MWQAPAYGSRGRTGGVLARVTVATAEIVGFSAFAHARADGRLPSPDELLWVALGVGAATALLLTGRARLPQVLAACAGLQVALHVGYASLAPTGGHGMHAMTGGSAMHVMPTGTMVFAHAVSAVVTALVLLAQEQAVRRLAALGALRPHVVPVRTRPRTLAAAPAVRGRPDLVRVSPTRGPPQPLPPPTS